MNAKKNSRQDLEKRRGTVFAIGLLAAGSFTLAAFTYVSPVEKLEQTISANEARVEVYIQDAEEEEKEVEVIETKTADIVETEESTTTLTAEVTEDIKKVAISVTVGTIAMIIVSIVKHAYWDSHYLFPSSILMVEYFVCIFFLLVFRIVIKLVYSEELKNQKDLVPTVIYGAGIYGIITKHTLQKEAPSYQ